MLFFFANKVLKRLLAPRSSFAHALVAHGRICSVVLVLWSILSGALAQDIPSGFKVDRYARVWERNPFTLMKPTAPESPPSAFEKLFMSSWLKDGAKEVVLVQNMETNEVQRITAVSNQNNLRLVEMHPNSNPQFVEAIISDGKEQGTVKFRLDVQPSSGEPPLGAAGPASNQIEIAGGRGRSISPASLHRIHPRMPKVHTEGGPGPAATARKATQGKHFSPDSAAAQLIPNRN
jgi:hypothetical protein